MMRASLCADSCSCCSFGRVHFIGVKLSYGFGTTKQILTGGSKQRLQHELTKGMILLRGTQSCADMLPAAGSVAVQQHFDQCA